MTAADGSVTYSYPAPLTAPLRGGQPGGHQRHAPVLLLHDGHGGAPVGVGSGSTDAALLDTVRSVAVDLRLREPSRPRVRPMQVQTRVFLSNRFAEDVIKGIA